MQASQTILLAYIPVVVVVVVDIVVAAAVVVIVVVVVVMVATLSIPIEFLPSGRIAGIRKSEQWPAHHHTLSYTITIVIIIVININNNNNYKNRVSQETGVVGDF